MRRAGNLLTLAGAPRRRIRELGSPLWQDAERRSIRPACERPHPSRDPRRSPDSSLAGSWLHDGPARASLETRGLRQRLSRSRNRGSQRNRWPERLRSCCRGWTAMEDGKPERRLPPPRRTSRGRSAASSRRIRPSSPRDRDGFAKTGSDDSEALGEIGTFRWPPTRGTGVTALRLLGVSSGFSLFEQNLSEAVRTRGLAGPRW